jgi:hypothetical protein
MDKCIQIHTDMGNKTTKHSNSSKVHNNDIVNNSGIVNTSNSTEVSYNTETTESSEMSHNSIVNCTECSLQTTSSSFTNTSVSTKAEINVNGNKNKNKSKNKNKTTKNQSKFTSDIISLDKETLYCIVSCIETGFGEPICHIVVYTNYNSDLMIDKLQVVYNQYSDVMNKKTFANLCKNEGILKPPDRVLTEIAKICYDYKIMLRVNANDKIFIDGKYKDCAVKDIKSGKKLFVANIKFILNVNYDPTRLKKFIVQTGDVQVYGALPLDGR